MTWIICYLLDGWNIQYIRQQVNNRVRASPKLLKSVKKYAGFMVNASVDHGFLKEKRILCLVSFKNKCYTLTLFLPHPKRSQILDQTQ